MASHIEESDSIYQANASPQGLSGPRCGGVDWGDCGYVPETQDYTAVEDFAFVLEDGDFARYVDSLPLSNDSAWQNNDADYVRIAVSGTRYNENNETDVSGFLWYMRDYINRDGDWSWASASARVICGELVPQPGDYLKFKQAEAILVKDGQEFKRTLRPTINDWVWCPAPYGRAMDVVSR